MPDVLDHGLDCKASRYATQGKRQDSPPSDPARRRAIPRTIARELVYKLIKHAQAHCGAIGLATDAAGLGPPRMSLYVRAVGNNARRPQSCVRRVPWDRTLGYRRDRYGVRYGRNRRCDVAHGPDW